MKIHNEDHDKGSTIWIEDDKNGRLIVRVLIPDIPVNQPIFTLIDLLEKESIWLNRVEVETVIRLMQKSLDSTADCQPTP